MEGHLAKAFPYQKTKRTDNEAHGHKNNVAGVVTAIQGGEKPLREKIEDTRRMLQDVQVAEAIEKKSRTMSTVEVMNKMPGAKQGPVVFAPVSVEGVDGGAGGHWPVTTVSLDFALIVLAKQRSKNLTPTQWKKETMKLLKSPREIMVVSE